MSGLGQTRLSGAMLGSSAKPPRSGHLETGGQCRRSAISGPAPKIKH